MHTENRKSEAASVKKNSYKEKEKKIKTFFNFFLLRSLFRHPPTTPESFTHMGPAMCESISDQLGKSPVLGYQSLARYRSLGFDHSVSLAGCSTIRYVRMEEGREGRLTVRKLRHNGA